MRRTLGFYRPYGFKKNIYMVFKTYDRQKHYTALHNQYNREEMQLAFEMFANMGYSSSSEVLYSEGEYDNHNEKFTELINKLKSDGNLVEMRKHEHQQYQRWPYVTLSEKNFANRQYLEQMLNNKS